MSDSLEIAKKYADQAYQSLVNQQMIVKDAIENANKQCEKLRNMENAAANACDRYVQLLNSEKDRTKHQCTTLLNQ